MGVTKFKGSYVQTYHTVSKQSEQHDRMTKRIVQYNYKITTKNDNRSQDTSLCSVDVYVVDHTLGQQTDTYR